MVSFLVASSPARFLEGKEGLLGVKLDPGRETERALEVSLPGALGVLEEVLLDVLVASGSAPVLLWLAEGFIVLLGTFSASGFFKSVGCRVADMGEVTDLAFSSSFLADPFSTTSFFLTTSELAKEMVLETKEAGFLAEEVLPCSLDSNWRKLSGLRRKT